MSKFVVNEDRFGKARAARPAWGGCSMAKFEQI